MLEAAALRLAGSETPIADAEALFRGVSGFSRADILTRGGDAVPEALERAVSLAVSRRVSHEPIQYILGRAAFWRDEFVVTPAVLIPRPETEGLVEEVARRLRPTSSPRILDLGTGSGCIALSVLRECPSARALAVDVSQEALAVARENAARLHLSARIEFRCSDWFDGIPAGEAFDAIVSNPPYVAPSDRDSLHRTVRDFEPAQALFAEAPDGLSSYRAIIGGAFVRLPPLGLIALEVGQGQAARVGKLLRDAGFGKVETKKDLASIDRVLLAQKS